MNCKCKEPVTRSIAHRRCLKCGLLIKKERKNSMNKTLEAELTRGLDKTKLGKISRIILPDKSKIYISKKGWNLVTPKGIEINMPYSEINLAINETIAQGYIIKKDDKKSVKKVVEIRVSGVKIKCPDDFYDLIEDLADRCDCYFGGIRLFDKNLVNQLKKAGLIRKSAKAGEITCGTDKLRKLEKKILDDYLDAKDKVEKCHS